jgi:diguanylate cyclase (GGDEF)-like protein/PAS domain S-box-containing protein
VSRQIFIGGHLVLTLIACLTVPQLAGWVCMVSSIVLLVLLGFIGKKAKELQQSSLRLDERPRPEEQESTIHRLRDSEQIFDSLFDHNPNAIAVFDQFGNFTRVNAAAESMLGFTAGELAHLPFVTFVAQDHLLVTLQGFDQVRRGNASSFETAIIHRTGYRVDLSATAIPLVVEQETRGSILIGQDITERKRVDAQVRYMAFYDDMTGLPNRLLFNEQLNETLKTMKSAGTKLAVFYLDIDRFKLVNDSFGHDYGNMLLMQLAERFTRCITDHDFLARSEGDEFSFFYPNVEDHNDVLTLVAGIIRVLEEPFLLEQNEIHVTASIGIAISSDENEDAETLTKYADIALARAKEKGYNEFQIFNTDMKSVSLNRLKLESELRKAISNDEFELYYQPQMDIETARIVGVEALIRWNHPERGLILPNHFIPLAEESGLIVPLGEWVLRAACKQNKEWQEQGYDPFPIAVNLSMRQFFQHNLKGKINQVLLQTGLEPHYLELEITESMTMDVEYAIQSLLELKELGVKISIDDFGTGYSSLYYLKRFPIDKLKIDRSFVRDIMIDPNDAAIVTTIISMTHHLNLKVIAEGVETKEQLHFLHNNQCNEIQGYWFSPPLDATHLEYMLKKEAVSEVL